MFTIRRKSEADKVALPRRFLIATKAVVRKVAYLIVAEIEQCDRLPHATFLCTVSLIEKCGVAAIRTQHNCCRITVGARDEAGDWNCEDSACGNRYRAGTLVCLGNSENETNNDAGDTESGGCFVHIVNTCVPKAPVHKHGSCCMLWS